MTSRLSSSLMEKGTLLYQLNEVYASQCLPHVIHAFNRPAWLLQSGTHECLVSRFGFKGRVLAAHMRCDTQRTSSRYMARGNDSGGACERNVLLMFLWRMPLEAKQRSRSNH
jgi:hypothetical protein